MRASYGRRPQSFVWVALSTLGALGGRASALVSVEQFGMAQCPMTSTLTTDFWNDCEYSLRAVL